MFADDQSFRSPIDGTLDLHTFRPDETGEVVHEYIGECLRQGICQLRIIHGKGSGVQRRIVHSLLDGHPNVLSYRSEGGSAGGWGATIVDIRQGSQ
ncbi:MAG: Smr/MutS family protein [Candidatus Zixiibacteriota bacterium]